MSRKQNRQAQARRKAAMARKSLGERILRKQRGIAHGIPNKTLRSDRGGTPAASGILPTRQHAQAAIDYLQHLLNDDGCPPTLDAIITAVDIAIARHLL